MHIYIISIPALLQIGNVSIDNQSEIFVENIAFPAKINESISVDANYHKDRYGFPLSNSEILNFMAHRQAWKKFLHAKEPWCLILESNVNIHIDSQTIQSSICELPEDWELFFPYDAREYHAIIEKEFSTKEIVNPNYREMQHWDPYLLGYQWGNSIYFVSRQGAEKLLAIDTIRQRLDDEILMLGASEKLNVFTGEADWFDFNQMKQVVFKDRNHLIWEAICENSTWTALRKERARSLLKVISDVANRLNTSIILQAGTHLGYVRHGGLIPWDDDIDVGIEEGRLLGFLEQLEKVDGICYGKVSEYFTKTPYYKIWHKDGETIENYHYTFPFVDLWLYNIKGNDLVFKDGIICPDSALHDFY